MKKILVRALTLVLSLGILAGCGAASQSSDGNTPATKEAETATATAAAPATPEATPSPEINITHSKGSFTLPETAKKVVVFDMGALDTIDKLGADVEIAVPTSNIPSSLSKYETAYNAGTLFEPDMEAIFNFEPDVIIIGERQSDYFDKMNEIAPTLFVQLNPATYMDDFKQNTENIAAVLGKTEEAKTHLAAIDAEIQAISAVAQASEEKALVILTNDGKISAYGKGSRFGLIHHVLGVKTVDEAIEASTHGQSTSYEYISEKNPDILFVVDRTVIAGGSQKASDTLNNDLVNATNAAKNSKIVYLNPEAWYLADGGLNNVALMLSEVKAVLQ